MRAAVIALLSLLAAALPLCAGIRFEPPVADAHTSVDIVVYGVSGGGGAPLLNGFSISGRTITVRMLNSPGGISAPIAWWIAAHVGVLAAGVYDVVVTYDGHPGKPSTLIVRDDSLWVTRHVVPMNGADLQFSPVETTFDYDPIWSVSIDGGPWLARDGWTFHIPPHEPETVEVKARTESGKLLTARAFLSFFDPAAPPDLALFEPILFPVAFSGGGAFGTQWSTTNTLSARRTTWFRSPLPCNGCSDSLASYGPVTLARGGAAGHFLWVERGTASDLSLHSRSRETSRGAVTPIPVFREADAKSGDVNFSGIPWLANRRAILRVWSLSDDAAMTLTVGIGNNVKGGTISAVMTRPAAGAPYFSTVDLTSAIEKIGSDVAIRVGTSNYYEPFEGRTWVLLSLTDNATQQTTIFPPD